MRMRKDVCRIACAVLAFGCLCLGAVAAVVDRITIDYDFSKKGERFLSRQELNRTVEALAFDFSYGVDVRLTLKLIDAGGQVFQRTFGILSAEWQYVELNVSDKGWQVSGGDGSGLFRQPAAFAEFVVDHALSDISASIGKVRIKSIVYLDKKISERAAFMPPFDGMPVDEALARASNACARLRVAVPQLESRGLGAKSRASLTVLEKFFGWVATDQAKGLKRRIPSEVREMASLGERAAERAEAILAGQQKDFPVPKTRLGKIAIAHAQAIADRVWPDGRVDRGPVFFNGFGHFSTALQDMGIFPSLGCNLLQIEIGPAWVLTSETGTNDGALKRVLGALDRAEKVGVGVNVLLSPHYWPAWTRKKGPQFKECSCYAGFCPYDPAAREVLKRYFQFVIPVLKGKKALHSFCLSNEPSSNNCEKCPRLRKAWQKELAKKYGTVDALNRATGLSVASFDAAVVPPVKNDGNPTPIALEFIRFNRQIFAEWHRWMADCVHELAPNVPVHAKIQINPVLWPCWIFNCIDPVAFGRLSQYNGNDAVVFMMDANRSWGHNWWWMEMGYDFQRSAADLPIINSENHIHPDRSHGKYLPGVQTFAALWQSALHGQNASALWCWDRSYDNGKSDFNGLILERPECLEAYAHCALDLTRLADRLAPIQNLPPSMLLLYSTESIMRGGGELLMRAYRAANFLGQPLGVVSEEMLAGFGRGTEHRPFDSAKVILLPLVKGQTLAPALQAGLDRLVAAGVRVIATGEEDERALHRTLAVRLRSMGLPDYPVALDPETGLASFGVETRGLTQNGVTRVSLCNQTSRPLRVRMAKAGTDLVTGHPTETEFDMRPLEVKMVEY